MIARVILFLPVFEIDVKMNAIGNVVGCTRHKEVRFGANDDTTLRSNCFFKHDIRAPEIPAWLP